MQNVKYAFNIIKVQYMRGGKAQGAEYTYKSQLHLEVPSEMLVKARGKHLLVKVVDVISPADFKEYDEAVADITDKGFSLDKVTEITQEDLLLTLEKQKEEEVEDGEQ